MPPPAGLEQRILAAIAGQAPAGAKVHARPYLTDLALAGGLAFAAAGAGGALSLATGLWVPVLQLAQTMAHWSTAAFLLVPPAAAWPLVAASAAVVGGEVALLARS